jgi:signal recognition particle receptor subunit beta
VLKQNETERRWGLGEECNKAVVGLQKLLQKNQAPHEYKAAVIGRFKAGKSSFVNVLLDRRLAGVDTSPETAAVTTLRAGDKVIAKINLIDKSVWNDLKALHRNDPTDPEAHRVANWLKFGKGLRSGSPAETEAFDLDQIESEHLRAGGHTLIIPMNEGVGREAQRKAETDFQRRIKQYTSSTKPQHCLVESIEIETPSDLLGEGVTLVDTPGLDDTERFRVQLTERAVQDVDAVLFLTKSGASYGQSEKDFVLSLLRKGTIKQLIFVVTQVDHTYEQHVREARDQDIDPDPIAVRIEAERRRLRAEIEATLDELAGEAGSAAAARYRDQLNSVEIAFTSAANHTDHIRKETIKFPIAPDDPGGMRNIKETLFRILSTESRLAATKYVIQTGVISVLQEMVTVVEKRGAVIRGLRSREVAEQKLATFRGEFEENGRRFSEVTLEDCSVLNTTLTNRNEQESLIAEIIAHQADEILGAYEADDAGRHWRTRRCGKWGYLHELQNRVANRVFPKIAEELSKKTDAFGEFVSAFRVHLQSLSDEANATVARLEIGNELKLDVGADLEVFLSETLNSLQELVVGEETKIVALLEEFVDQDVADKIAAAREKVAGVLGRGTTAGQTTQVREFYRDVRSILKEALRTHVHGRFRQFSAHLTAHADAIPEKALSQVRVRIEQTSTDIRTAAEAALAGEKQAFEETATELVTAISTARTEVLQFLADELGEKKEVPKTQPIAPPLSPKKSPEISSPESIRENAKQCVERHILQNGAKGWPFTRVFARRYLQGASEAWLIDPYLALRFQRRNLTEFVMILLEGAKLKTLHINTREKNDPPGEADEKFFKQLDRDSFEKGGMRVDVMFDDDVHDRFLILNNGCVFKLGRGLDIFKPAAGLAARDAALRQVRPCEIDVFMPSDEPA